MIVALGSVSGFGRELGRPGVDVRGARRDVLQQAQAAAVPAVHVVRRSAYAAYADQLTVILLVSPDAIVTDATVPGTSTPLASTAVTT